MSREFGGIMGGIAAALAEENESRADAENARAMYDHIYETLTDLGYSQEVAADVAASASSRLMELCGR